MKIFFYALIIIAFSFLQSNVIWAQQDFIKPFSINQSSLINDLKSLEVSNPNILVTDFITSANSLLERQGLNFTVGLDSATCQKIEQLKKAQKTPNAPLNLSAILKSSLGESAKLSIPEADFSKAECLPCFITLSFLENTDKEFVTIVKGKNLKFFLPVNFLMSEAFLVDEKDLTTVVKKWRLPVGTTPISISDDGNILYLGFEEPELTNLTLAAFSEGVFQFNAKKDLDSSKKRTVIDAPQNDNSPARFYFIKFESEGIVQIVKLPSRCQN